MPDTDRDDQRPDDTKGRKSDSRGLPLTDRPFENRSDADECEVERREVPRRG